MRLAGREIAAELLQELQQRAPECSRRELARELCARGGWLAPGGRPATMSARKALAELTRRGYLPPPRGRPPPARRKSAGPAAPCAPITGPLESLGPLEFILLPAGASALSREWNELLDRCHYLGAGPLCGAQLRYLVRSARGPVAALAFSGAAWQVAARDRWIGWTAEQRREHLHLVVNNSRWLIPAHVQVPNLASHVLGRVLARLPADWEQRYGYPPVLVETFVEHGRFQGGGYQAANWQAIGLTQGRGRQDRTHQGGLARKVLWVYPLRKDARRVLCQVPAVRRLAPLPAPAAPVAVPAVDWAEEEMGRARLGDRRLVARACTLARAFYARPREALPQACGSLAATKAAYRFCAHPHVTLPALLESHYESTARRVAAEAVVLAVQDTTSLNYSTHPATEQLGPIGSQLAGGPVGIQVHSTLACNVTGSPLGLLDVQHWTRDPADFGINHRRKQRAFEEKESVRWRRSLEALERRQAAWPGTRLVSVGDREADIYELFVWATAKSGRPALLVRAEKDRLLAEGQPTLWAQVLAQPLAGELTVAVPRRHNRPSRVAGLSIRWAAVVLQPPDRKGHLGPVRVWAVLAREETPPPGLAPLEWMLLTTLAVTDVATAIEKLRWYTLRWGIEVFHRVLKSGCKVEDRQLGTADALAACLALDLVVAWRIYRLSKLGRATPDVPCTEYFADHEWQALVAAVHRDARAVPATPPSLHQAMRMVASLGGFLGRKSDGEPGAQTLWRGLQQLDAIVLGWCLRSEDPVLQQQAAARFQALMVSSNPEYG
jgi:hypothetical protein